MGKLGKKARKFAKKNLQSVYKRNRKINSMIKKKHASRNKRGKAEHQKVANDRSNERKPEDIEETCLDTIFSEDDIDVVGDDSDSDGFLSEDSSFSNIVQSEKESIGEETIENASLTRNREIDLELAKKKKRLLRLKEKDPGFSKFLQSYNNGIEALGNEEIFTDDETNNDIAGSVNDDNTKLNKGKILTASVISSWCQLVKEQNSVPALTCLINGFRAACHYGTESGFEEDVPLPRIQNSRTYCNILTFMLGEADSVFRGLLGVSTSSCKKDTIQDLKNTSKWKVLKPLIKSYLRSTLFLLDQVSNADILTMSLTRLRASLIFFAAFPYLLRRLIKVAVHLWASGEEALSSCSFLILLDVANAFSSDYFDTCLIKCYKAFIARCKFMEPVILKKTQLMRDSIVELCSLDVQRTYTKALLSVQQLAKILQHALQSKKKESVEKICSWQYICCIDLWVTFISANIADNDLKSLLFTITQVVNGIASLFSGPRYLPLRFRCIHWFNRLSSSSGIFIPIASFVLDVLDYKICNDGGNFTIPLNLSAIIKLPKNWLKFRNLQEECIFSAIELLSEHFAYWSYHISFPELATIPIIRLRKFSETTSNESFRRLVKRLIDQVEQNIEFVQKKRDEVSFSPKDQQLVDSFLQLEKPSKNTSFVQYYCSIMEKATSRNMAMNEKISLLEQKRSEKRKQQLQTQSDVSAKVEIDSEIAKINPPVKSGKAGNKRKKQRT